MFCTKCGAQNPDNSNFCRSCGAKMSAKETTVTKRATDINSRSTNYYQKPMQHQQSLPHQVQKPAINNYYVPPVRPSSYSMKSNVKALYIFTLLFHVISIILFFVPSLFSRASFGDSIEKEEVVSMFQLLCNGSFGLAFVVTAITIASAVLTALPIFTTQKRPSKLVVPKIITALELLWLFLCILIMVSEASVQKQRYSDTGIEASAGLTIGGFLYLASLLAVFVMLFVTTSKSKR
ncbi:MAG: zinc-ribbon domain-containing protein [Clostridia bacterium]|nr:zinc-ribbon domain-containing protein [Clostridia bacterium]